MEGNLPSANMMGSSGSYGGFDLQSSMRNQNQQHSNAIYHQHNPIPRQGGSMVHQTIHENFPLTIGSILDHDQTVYKAKCLSDEEDRSFTEDASEGINDVDKANKKASPWHRVKWTDTMVRLLITAVSYINEEAASEYSTGGRKKYVNLHKKGKWKSVSKVMAERNHFVSPQQCEDKFNDLNKRYKRLNEILGRGTSCEVVENPSLLDVMDHIPEKGKEEVRKILSSKHLHYEEMCSYHNGNRLHLPPDPELHHSLKLALRSNDEHDKNDEDEHDEHEDDHVFQVPPLKKTKQCLGHENINVGSSLHVIDCNQALDSQIQNVRNEVSPEVNVSQKEWLTHRSFQLEEQRVHIQAEGLNLQAQMLELEKERFKWQRYSVKKDREIEMMRLENKRMKLENERMEMELRKKELAIDS